MKKNYKIFYSGQNFDESTNSIDYVIGLIGQVSLALLIIFIIATVIFGKNQQRKTQAMENKVQQIEETPIGQVYKELETVKEQLRFLQEKNATIVKLAEKEKNEKEIWHEKAEKLQEQKRQSEKEKEELQQKLNNIADSPAAQKAKALENAIIDIQKQKLLIALEKIYSSERANLRLNMFIHEHNNGERVFRPQRAVTEMTVDKHIKLGCEYANKILLDKEKLKQAWYNEILSNAGLQNELSEKNKNFISNEISNKIEIIYYETVDLHCRVLAQLQDYFLSSPETIKNEEIRQIVKKWIETQDKERKAMLTVRIQEKIGDYTKRVLEEQGVELLREALKSIKQTWQ